MPIAHRFAPKLQIQPLQISISTSPVTTMPLDPNALPFYLHPRKQQPTPDIAGFPQEYGHYYTHLHFPAYYDPRAFCLFYPPNPQFVKHEALLENGEMFRARRKGLVKKNSKRLFHRKTKEQAQWRVKDQANEEKKVPENAGAGGDDARRTVAIPFPTTVEETEISNTTTVMIRNVPNQLKINDLLLVLDDHCFQVNDGVDPADWSKFDFVYLPMDYRKHAFERRKSNLGYAFVNFTTTGAAFKFYQQFHGIQWNVRENKKTCEINAAQQQGKEALMRIFSRKIFLCKSRDFLPLAFFPEARDGLNRQIEGVPVGKHIWGVPKKSIGT